MRIRVEVFAVNLRWPHSSHQTGLTGGNIVFVGESSARLTGCGCSRALEIARHLPHYDQYLFE